MGIAVNDENVLSSARVGQTTLCSCKAAGAEMGCFKGIFFPLSLSLSLCLSFRFLRGREGRITDSVCISQIVIVSVSALGKHASVRHEDRCSCFLAKFACVNHCLASLLLVSAYCIAETMTTTVVVVVVVVAAAAVVLVTTTMMISRA